MDTIAFVADTLWTLCSRYAAAAVNAREYGRYSEAECLEQACNSLGTMAGAALGVYALDAGLSNYGTMYGQTVQQLGNRLHAIDETFGDAINYVPSPDFADTIREAIRLTEF